MSSFFILRRLENNMITHIQDGAFDGLKDLFEMWVWNPFVETCICIKLAFFRYLVEGEKSPADRFFFYVWCFVSQKPGSQQTGDLSYFQNQVTVEEAVSKDICL